MIVNLPAFIKAERPYWDELDEQLDYLETEPAARMDLESTKRLHYLYERTASDLNQVRDRVAEDKLRLYLEALTARAYCEIYSRRRDAIRFHPLRGFFITFPRTLRKHAGALYIAFAVLLLGSLFGAGIFVADPDLKSDFLPFPHLLIDPSERVTAEESGMQHADAADAGGKTFFASYLFQNNTRVSILVMAMGMTFGIGTVIILFYNGIIMGMVAADFIMAGESVFLAGWLLPHGSVEIPAIIIAGQTGLILARALIGHGDRAPCRQRLQVIRKDVLVLIAGAAVILVWAAVVEAFFSQYHAPIITYGTKITFGSLQLALLAGFLILSGRSAGPRKEYS